MPDPTRVAAHEHDTDVLVVGAGPTGLALATALALRGVRLRLVDQLAEGANSSRAAVVHARTLEVLEPLGVVPTLVARGLQAPRFTVRDRDRVLVCIDFGALPTRYPYGLMLSQAVTEQVLLDRFTSLGGRVDRPRRLVDLAQDGAGVTATLDDGTRLRARCVVGADGMHSTVRERAGIGFSGGRHAESFVLADVRLGGDLPHDEVLLCFSTAGMLVVAPLPDGFHRIVATVAEGTAEPGAAQVQALLSARAPRDARPVVQALAWASRFRIHHRLADRYRAGHIVLAGDAAHVHSPAGGQGMNAGILDAVRLADALVDALAGDVAALDRYACERRPVAQQVVALADGLTRLATVPPGWRVPRNLLLSGLARVPWFRRSLASRLSGLAYRTP